MTSSSLPCRMSVSFAAIMMHSSGHAGNRLAGVSALRAIVPWLRLQRPQIGIETIEALLPEPAVILEPIGGFLQWSGLKPARPPLLFAALGDHARLFEDLEMFRDRRQAHIERFCEFGDRGLAQGQPCQDRPPGGIGEGGKGGTETIAHLH